MICCFFELLIKMAHQPKITILLPLLLFLVASATASKPKQKGLIPGTAGPFAPDSSE
jgi:hypothetical protein